MTEIEKTTIIHVFWQRVEKSPDKASVLQKKNSAYRTFSWKESGEIVEKLSAALLSLGICRDSNSKAAIVSNTRAEWTWSDLACMSNGAVVVPIYPSLNPEETCFVINHCQAEVVFLENARQLRKLESMEKLPESLRFAVVFEAELSASAQTESAPATSLALPVYSFAGFLELGAKELATNKSRVNSLRTAVKASDLATIVYTSGTTGLPKGAMISHGNISFVCNSVANSVGFKSDDMALSFLPLSHIFERVTGQFLAIHEGIPMAYAESMDSVAENLVEVKPTIMNAVPRFYEKAYNKIQSQIRKLPTPQQYFARWALSLGKRALKAEENHKNGKKDMVRQIYRAELRVAERFVFRKIRSRFGGRLRFLVSGAAPLSVEVHQFFDSIGIPILEGYGLTETTAPIACNKPEGNRRGTVGKPLEGVEVKIAEDGEIMVRGPNVFSGYYKNEAATLEAFRDGWFLTGDIGDFDSDGYLRIKDRKKDIIITAGGKHVAPQVLENLLAGKGLVSRVLVYGDKRKYISALVTLNPDELKIFAQNESLDASLPELAAHPAVIESVQRQVDEANAKLAGFEQIKRFIVLDKDFSLENNELTPTLKLRRKFVTEKYRQLLDSLYEKEDLQIEAN